MKRSPEALSERLWISDAAPSEPRCPLPWRHGTRMPRQRTRMADSDLLPARLLPERLDESRAQAGRHSRGWVGWQALLVLGWVLLAGCDGCQRNKTLSREELEEQAKRRAEALEVGELLSIPPDADTQVLYAKGGHWMETLQEYKSNRDDLQVIAVGSIARGQDDVMLPGTNFRNDYARRTSLPQGQLKAIDLRFFVPFTSTQEDPVNQVSKRLTFRTELLNWPLLTPIQSSPSLKPANELKPHEFLLLAMGPHALGYEYLTSRDAIFWHGVDLMMSDRTRSYYVIKCPPQAGKYRMPSSMLSMTSIAAIVWDDVAPDDLSADQQNALLDWIHWGGQLLISGPSSWSRLQNSFLTPHLPVARASSVNLSTADFEELSAFWRVPDLGAVPSQSPIEVTGPPMSGLKFDLSDRGRWLPHTDRLVSESQVGRGRIVVTSFPLRDPRIYQWPFFSNFLSTGLLRRHPRMIKYHIESGKYAQFWARPFTGAEHDARLHSNLRILSRDLPYLADGSLVGASASGPGNPPGGGSATAGTETRPGFEASTAQAPGRRTGQELASSDSLDRAVAPDSVVSVPATALNLPDSSTPGGEGMQWGGRGAAWSDYSGLSTEALSALRIAAGVELPSRRTILKLLVGYLICLVPLNWIVFRMMGRLEWAWIAAPVMAIVGVFVVMHVARLDIGFARRTTEIAVLEMQGDHPRGHLTQYIALYTSLSTNYAIDFPENDAVALPLGDLSRSLRRSGSELRHLRTTYGRSAGVRLDPLTVYSNSTEMLHGEQIVEFPGGLRLGSLGEESSAQPAIRNDTGLNLSATLVLRRDATDQVAMAWIGDLPAGSSAPLAFQPLGTDTSRLWHHWARDPVTQPTEPTVDTLAGSETDALWIGGVLRAMVHKTPLMPGQTRLFAYTSDRFSKLKVTPREDQYDGRCLVVAHLTPAKLGPIVPDEAIISRGASDQMDEPMRNQPPDRSDADAQGTGQPTGARPADAIPGAPPAGETSDTDRASPAIPNSSNESPPGAPPGDRGSPDRP